MSTLKLFEHEVQVEDPAPDPCQSRFGRGKGGEAGKRIAVSLVKDDEGAQAHC